MATLISNLTDVLGAKPAQKPAAFFKPAAEQTPAAPTTKIQATPAAAASATDFPVPVVDFGAFSSSQDPAAGGAAAGGEEDLQKNKQAKRRVAKELDDALRTVGFVYLRNHGVSQDEVDRMFEWSHRFFALPSSTKRLAPHPPGGDHHRGYSALGQEKISQHTYNADAISSLRAAPDVKESFECGNELDKRQPNIWPPEDALPGFREGCVKFFEHCDRLAHQVLRALGMALALSLELSDADGQRDGYKDDMLSAAHASSSFQLRLLHYPPVSAQTLLSQAATRIGAHSDFGCITLLFQDAIGGLELETGEEGKKRFRPAPPIDGAVLVNVGDLLERWSNGRWRSTVHRVGVPASLSHRTNQNNKKHLDEQGTEEDEMCAPRYSIPFFAHPDADAVIKALPGCWDEAQNPKRFPPVTAGEYLKMRMSALY